jgi:Tol biopolymer transport system component
VCGDEDSEVVRVSSRHGDLEVIAELENLESLFLSPDDRFVVYDRAIPEDGGNFDVGMVSLETGATMPLIRHPAHDDVLGWVPGSDALLFVSDRDGALDAWAVRVSEGGAEGPPRLLQRDLGVADPLGFSRDGSLYFNRYKRWFSTGVAPFDLASGTVAMEAGTGILGSNTPPAWSPDGAYLAFVPEIEGPKGSGGPYRRPLHIFHIASGTKQEFASHLQTRNPHWSPDGRFVVVSARDTLRETGPFQGGLYTVDTRSGEVSQVLELDPATRTPYWSDLKGVWSADGTAVIYGLYDDAHKEGRLVWRDLESGEERVLFRDPNLASRQFALSPDGRRLVFGLRREPEGYSSGIHSGGRLMMLDLEGGEVEELHRIAAEGRAWSLQWASDGSHVLYYTKRGEEGTSVWRVSLSGGPAEKTWTFEEDCYDAYLNLSPDGKQAAYTTYHQENEVWVMENLRDVLSEKAGR